MSAAMSWPASQVPLTDPWRRVGPDIGLGAAGQVGSPASNATAGILNLDLGALDGVADGLNPFLHVLSDHDFLRHPSRLRNDRFLRRFPDLDGAVLEGVRRQVIGRPIHWPPLDVDVLFPQRDLLLDRRFADIGANPHAAPFDRSLLNVELFLHDRNAFLLTRRGLPAIHGGT